MAQQPNNTSQPQAGQTQGLDATALANAFKEAFAQNNLQPVQQQAPPTQEQLDQMLRTYRPDASLYASLFGDAASEETRMQALSSMIQGIVANATAHAQVLAEDYLQRYHGQISPHLEDASYMANTRFNDDLYTKAPALKQYEPLLKDYLPRFQQDKDYPRDRASRAQFVVDKFSAIMKGVDPAFDPTKVAQSQAAPATQSFGGQPSANTQTPSSSNPSLPALGAGASGGGQAGGSPPAPTSKMGWSLGD